MRRPASGRLTRLLAVVLLVLAGTAAYRSSFRGVFVWDDERAIVENPHIRQVWPLTRSMSAPPDTTVSGRPIASLSLALNFALAPPDVRHVMKPAGPADPPDLNDRFYRNIWGYHAVNVAVHLLAALALFGVVRRTLLSERLRETFAEASTGLALAIALLWVVHPLHTQAVTYIVQRVESLMGLFFLATLYCAIRASEQGSSRWLWGLGAVTACSLGMGSKEVMVTAPLMVVLWDWWFGPREAMRRRWPLYAALAATWAVLIVLVASPARPHSVGVGLGGWSSWSYLQTQAAVVAHYLRLVLVPSPLVFDYRWPPAASLAAVAPQAALLATVAGLTLVAFVRRVPAGFLGAWFFLILAPTSSVLPIATEVAAEHRMYLPAAAVIALLVLGSYTLVRRWLNGVYGEGRGRRLTGWGGMAVVGAFVVLLAGATDDRNRVYWSTESLMRDTVIKRPANAVARLGYGVALLNAGRLPEAEEQLAATLRLEADADTQAHAHMFLGSVLCAQGRLGEGISAPEAGACAGSDTDRCLRAAGRGLRKHGAGRAGRRSLRVCRSGHDNPLLLRRVAWFLATTPDDTVRNGARAVELAERARRLTGGQDPMSLEALGAAYAELDRFEEAAAVLREAVANAQAQGNQQFASVLQQELALVTDRRKLRVPPR